MRVHSHLAVPEGKMAMKTNGFHEHTSITPSIKLESSNGYSPSAFTLRNDSLVGSLADQTPSVVFNVPVKTGLGRYIDLGTRKGRRNSLILLLGVALFPVFFLIGQNVDRVSKEVRAVADSKLLKNDILYSVDIGRVLHNTQIERGTTTLYVSSGGDQSVLATLEKRWLLTDAAIGKLSKWPGQPDVPHFASVQTYHDRIIHFRENLNQSNLTGAEVSVYVSLPGAESRLSSRHIDCSPRNRKAVL